MDNGKIDINKIINEYKNEPLENRLPKTKICQKDYDSNHRDQGCNAEIPYSAIICPNCGKKFKRVAFWNRLSHENSVERDAPRIHFNIALNNCNSNNWVMVREYALLDVQGQYIDKEPEYLKYRFDVEKDNFDILQVTEVKRFARRIKLLLRESDFLDKHKKDIVLINQKIDTTSPMGRVFFQIMAVLAELESYETSYRIKRGITLRAKKLKPLGNNAPFGWVWECLDNLDKEELLDMGYSMESING